MSGVVISIEELSKQYRLGQIGGGALKEDINRWWARLRGKPDPTLKIGETDHGNRVGETIWALRNVNLEVKYGGIVGIIGRNGAGKSTLLKILSRTTAPTSGQVKIKGRVASLLEVGTGFHPDLTGRENIYLNGVILGMSRTEIDRKFDAIVAFSEIERFLDTPVKRYSSGMYVRLAFAVAAHLEPDILIVDEVLAVGDNDFQKKCLGKMGDIAGEGRTVLMVSHNMASVVNLCQRAVLLSAGEVVTDGRVSDVVRHYLSTGRSAGGQVVWPDPAKAPGNDVVRLHAVRILQDGVDGPTAGVDISKDFLIQITYWNLREGAQLYPGIWLRTAIGSDVLASSNIGSINLVTDPWYRRPQPHGMFQAICTIPGTFLNEGRYKVTAFLGTIPNTTEVIEEDLLSFDVHDTGEMRKEYYGGWLGVVRPRLAWRTEFIEPDIEKVGNVEIVTPHSDDFAPTPIGMSTQASHGSVD